MSLHTVDGDVTAEHLRALSKLRDNQEIDERRKRFRETVFDYIKKLRSAPQNEVVLAMDHLREQLRNDRAQLDVDLKRAKFNWMTSRDGAVAMLVAAGTGIATIVSGGATLAGAAAAVPTMLSGVIGLRAYQDARRVALEKHWTSWLFHRKRC
jgi:Asp-tRNA(Asn)/Glu-tRNA(Gln) amidotransferase C subunit